MDAIIRHSEAYKSAHPRTADTDLVLVKAYCAGLSAVHVALDHGRCESTVYRALNRARDFVRFQERSDRWQPLLDDVMELSSNFGDCDAGSLLEMLFEKYCDWNDLSSERSKMDFQEIHTLLIDACIGDTEPVMDVFCDVCHDYQRTGFCEGIRLGIRLYEELNR